MLPPYLEIPPQLATAVPIERCSVGSINVCEVAPQSATDMKRMDNRITEANRLLLPHGVMRCKKHKDNRGRLRSFSARSEDCNGSWMKDVLFCFHSLLWELISHVLPHNPQACGNVAHYVAAVIPSAALNAAVGPKQPHTTSAAGRLAGEVVSNCAAVTPDSQHQTVMSAHDVPAVCLQTTERLFVDDDEWCLCFCRLVGITALTPLNYDLPVTHNTYTTHWLNNTKFIQARWLRPHRVRVKRDTQRHSVSLYCEHVKKHMEPQTSGRYRALYHSGSLLLLLQYYYYY